MLSNVWSSLKRAADGHWGDQATCDPDPAGGYKATLRLASKIKGPLWELASKYIRMYARKSHWKVSSLTHKRGYVELHLQYAPPKPRPNWHRGRRRSHAETPPGQDGLRSHQHEATSSSSPPRK